MPVETDNPRERLLIISGRVDAITDLQSMFDRIYAERFDTGPDLPDNATVEETFNHMRDLASRSVQTVQAMQAAMQAAGFQVHRDYETAKAAAGLTGNYSRH